MFCGKCGKELKEGSKFCGFCGFEQPKRQSETFGQNAVTEKNNSVKSTQKRIAKPMNVHEKYEFSQPKYFMGLLGGGYRYKTIYTTIEINKPDVHIKQWGEGIFAGDKKEITIGAKDISEICTKRVVAWGWVVYMAFAILGALLAVVADQYFYAVLCVIVSVLSFFKLKRKEVVLVYQGSQIMIPDSDENMESVHNMTAIMQQINPSIRAMDM